MACPSCLCLRMCAHSYVMVRLWRSEGKLVLSSHLVCSQIIGLGGKHLYLLSHFARSSPVSFARADCLSLLHPSRVMLVISTPPVSALFVHRAERQPIPEGSGACNCVLNTRSSETSRGHFPGFHDIMYLKVAHPSHGP